MKEKTPEQIAEAEAKAKAAAEAKEAKEAKAKEAEAAKAADKAAKAADKAAKAALAAEAKAKAKAGRFVVQSPVECGKRFEIGEDFDHDDEDVIDSLLKAGAITRKGKAAPAETAE